MVMSNLITKIQFKNVLKLKKFKNFYCTEKQLSVWLLKNVITEQ